jgi:hypothetical protein
LHTNPGNASGTMRRHQPALKARLVPKPSSNFGLGAALRLGEVVVQIIAWQALLSSRSMCRRPFGNLL